MKLFRCLRLHPLGNFAVFAYRWRHQPVCDTDLYNLFTHQGKLAAPNPLQEVNHLRDAYMDTTQSRKLIPGGDVMPFSDTNAKCVDKAELWDTMEFMDVVLLLMKGLAPPYTFRLRTTLWKRYHISEFPWCHSHCSVMKKV